MGVAIVTFMSTQDCAVLCLIFSTRYHWRLSSIGHTVQAPLTPSNV